MEKDDDDDETPAEESSTPGARNELQNGTDRDSNDWYQHVYGEEQVRKWAAQACCVLSQGGCV